MGVDPEGRYNSLVIANWKPSLYVLIEANKNRIKDMERYTETKGLFDEFYDGKLEEKDKHLKLSYTIKEASANILGGYRMLGEEAENLLKQVGEAKTKLTEAYETAKGTGK